MSEPVVPPSAYADLPAEPVEGWKWSQTLLPRPHLLKRIRGALHKGHVFVEAPGGYGKSTLLQSLVNHLPESYYLPLTPEDCDLAVLQARIEALPTEAAVIVLDDLQQVEEADEVIAWLAGRLQLPSPGWVLAGRTIPPVLPAAAVALAPVCILSAGDLAFRAAESKSLLAEVGEARASQWHKRTQGWPLALALYARLPAGAQGTLNGEAARDGEISSPAQRGVDQLFDRLAQRLFGGLPVDLLAFMQRSAVPRHINAQLAAALTDTALEEAAAQIQEVLRRNLFLGPSEKPGWLRYHDLIREHLLRGFDPAESYGRVVRWFVEHGDLPEAIEHALDAGDTAQAGALLARLPHDFVMATGKYRTLLRWANALDKETRREHPLLLRDLALALAEQSDRNESLRLLDEARAYAEARGDWSTASEILLDTASTYITAGDAPAAQRVLGEIGSVESLPLAQRRRYLKSLGAVHYFLSDFRGARRAYTQALELPDEGDAAATARLRQNLITTALLPLGDFAKAAHQAALCAPILAEQLVGRIWLLITECWRHEAAGDWPQLAAGLEQIEALRRQAEELDEEDAGLLVLQLYLATGEGRFDDAQELLRRLDAGQSEHADLLMYVEHCRVWLLRRMGRYAEAAAAADAALAEAWDAPYNNGILAVERACACYLGGMPWQGIDAAGGELLRLRARPWIVRLQALRALRCPAGDSRRRRALAAVVRATRIWGYADLLITREPDLGAHFWTLCVAEGVAVEAAQKALRRLERSDLPAALLHDAQAEVRERTAQVLANLGDETSIPRLAEALGTEPDPRVRAEMEAALVRLEAVPPPPLRVRLMGEFAARRGDKPIAPGSWQRPAARRLFQYLVLNQGRALPRDAILEDLWPDSTPETAHSSFRTVYSWLRKAIEPYLRPKTPSRYIQVEQETYTFNPARSPALVECDVFTFERIVRPVLGAADDYEVRPLPPEFVAALEGYRPLLPELSYEAWTVEPRERLQNLYLQGCLYAASALLDVDRANEAAAWADRAVTLAPWLEEGWMELIRAQARGGNRTLALKTYATAVEALQRELDAPPSPALAWLAKRLRAGQDI